jgi:hypothetical protein
VVPAVFAGLVTLPTELFAIIACSPARPRRTAIAAIFVLLAWLHCAQLMSWGWSGPIRAAPDLDELPADGCLVTPRT